ncbi:nucleolar complex-associated protein-domain-containing protein [Podospora aff. communis PSN243]|uniref:Nucleolar complex-associated protein 3 n=1 Tax=Podospora aff. communis PSN243 TaxID=3040156 RepID=A0AAV9H7S9_9PEZI|nr:nucleolar complex-associated protein-domain-containing protein [Podospora aff. communis PSN243]
MASHPSKRRRLSDDDCDSAPNGRKVQKQFFKSAANWNLENDYANRPRKGIKKDKKKQKKGSDDKDSGRLPIKAASGAWVSQEDEESIASDAEWLENEGDTEPASDEEEAPAPEEPKIPEREQIRRAQEEMAKIAIQLNEEPEEYPGAFKALAKIGDSHLPSIRKLAIVTQAAIYKDVIPGYRIRPAAEDPSGEKLSKDVKKLRVYEQALVTGYQAYLKTLAQYATIPPVKSEKPTKRISSIAISCACTLLNVVPHFNFRGDLLRILVRKLSARRPDADFVKCRQALEKLFRDDEEGRPSMEAVSLLSKMMKAREYNTDESVINLFLNLRLLSEFSGTGSHDRVDREVEEGLKPKPQKVFRTKKERKRLKEQKAAEKVMAQADATVTHEEREQMQSETLKMVFATYFRILKQRSPHLMGAVLEGLAKYSHLINQDFFGDLLEALKDLIRYAQKDEDGDEDNDEDDDDTPTARDTSREAMLCTVTAFALLAGQDAHNARSNLHLDLSFFTTHLYRSLLSLSVNADLELGAKSLHLPDPDSLGDDKRNTKVNIQTTTALLIRCLSGVLLPPWNIRSVPPLRLAAFTKQLMSSSLQMPEKSCQAVLGLLQDVIHTHGKKINALWNTEERKGDGTFKPLAETVEASNPFTATVWEGELLRKHYCPKVREELKAMEKNLKAI